EGTERDRESRLGRDVEPARIELVQAHRPRPRDSARAPASSITMITRRRIRGAGVTLSSRAPMREPSITPRIAGTTTSGSSAPRWRYTHAAELLITEIRSPLEPTATLSGAAISNLSAGTVAKPAPRLKMP